MPEWAELQEEAVSNTLARNRTPLLVITRMYGMQQMAAYGKVLRTARIGRTLITGWLPLKIITFHLPEATTKVKIFVGAGYQRQDGIAPNTYFQRYSGSAQLRPQVIFRLRVGNNLALSFQNQRGVQQDQDYLGGVGTVLRMSPLIAVYKQPGYFRTIKRPVCRHY